MNTAEKRLEVQLVKGADFVAFDFTMDQPGQTGGQDTPSAGDLPVQASVLERPLATPSPMAPSGFSNHAIHMVRTLQLVTLAFSQMADQKASILMGATFLVFTISIGQARSGNMPYSLSVLALFAFMSALCAVFAVLPSVGGIGKVKSAIPLRKRKPTQPNKLFFGVFSAIPEEEWIDSVIEELRADETVFRTMLRDVHQNGKVLQGKKYRFLGYAYRVFILGLCLTLFTYTLEHVFGVLP